MSLQNLTDRNLKFPAWILPAVLITGLLAVMVLVDPFKSPVSSGASLSTPCFIDTTSIIDELQKTVPDRSRKELGDYLVSEYSLFTRELIKANSNGKPSE